MPEWDLEALFADVELTNQLPLFPCIVDVFSVRRKNPSN